VADEVGEQVQVREVECIPRIRCEALRIEGVFRLRDVLQPRRHGAEDALLGRPAVEVFVVGLRLVAGMAGDAIPLIQRRRTRRA